MQHRSHYGISTKKGIDSGFAWGDEKWDFVITFVVGFVLSLIWVIVRHM